MTTGKLDGKVALVTGGASGIGRAVCERFAQDGARVIVADLDAARCETVATEIGGGALGLALDVTRQESIDAVVRQSIEATGGIDILVNAAGIYDVQSILEITRERHPACFR